MGEKKKKLTARELIAQGYSKSQANDILAKATHDIEEVSPAKETEEAMNKVLDKNSKKERTARDLFIQAYSQSNGKKKK